MKQPIGTITPRGIEGVLLFPDNRYAKEGDAMTQHCLKCGLPMSYCDQPLEDDPQWICDGPNDNTTKRGCGEAIPAPSTP